ncbi:hypothetical protein [Mucilaginibacter phyllosphaerae]|uniref:Uncharacterized protein n=1 Tax=Mucilaginibacter phyllosphaerae TaxID=1812349 RepID=A0A4Y8AFC5_9SPHI|nr:hypothetical protein [Mucilaginibacter phyllosphaerae]MBB3971330.1 hypothetical protein [Mucilaginibacter phyllosphaerae]TEW66775.1 hypothetical protein E2R65_10190 [Mucilaginibacter phyllosphaerae]GGH11875.1 hypothetical protein GCM10007352_18320 [Mucilaginibacter phyllosphaerae]
MIKVDFEFEAETNTNYPIIYSKEAYSKAYEEAVKFKTSFYDADYSDAAKAHLSWYVAYIDGILKGKIYKDEQLVPQLFIVGAIRKEQIREFLNCHLFAAKDYCNHLIENIKPATVRRYDHTLRSLDVDLEQLLVNYEVQIRKSVDRVAPTSWRKPVLSPNDIFSAAKELFYIEDRDTIEDLYLRDLKPMVMFQIRQMVEIFGRQIIGYTDIVDKKDIPVKKFTQVAWEFIAEECKKKSSSRIVLPFPVIFMKTLNSWSNNFVHTSYIHSAYIQYYALHILTLLLKGSGSSFRIYNGNMQRKGHADIMISNYEELKKDFEIYINRRQPGLKVNWLPITQIQAYIISLGSTVPQSLSFWDKIRLFFRRVFGNILGLFNR